MGFLQKFLKGLAYLPTIILGVEHVFGPKQGSTKKAQADEIVSILLDTINATAQGDIVDIKQFNEGKDKMIEGAVQALNSTSAFRKLKG